MNKPVVQTSGGAVCGREDEACRMFLGIPYAEIERFEPPRPASWEGVLDAVGPETDCWQYASFIPDDQRDSTFYYEEFRSGCTFRHAESPMTLNIITPPQPENCPVLIFIHGGGHETGNVGELPYGTSTEYAKRGIILVSIAYRLNVFHMFRAKNFGLQDQVFAIRWIRDNIAAFGGDPEKITIMGQSAGAMSVMDLCYSDLLKGIVKGGVMMSGGGLVPQITCPWTAEQSKEFWDDVLRLAGVSTDEEAKKLPAEKLWRAWYERSRNPYNFHTAQPGIDGTIIPDLPQKLRAEGRILDIPMIMGITSQDFMPYVIYDMVRHFAMWSARHGRSPVWGYFFDRALPGNKFKAFHAADLWYMFGQMDKCWRPFEPMDYKLSAQMIDYVANFVRTGDPNGENLPPWKPLSPRQRGFRLFDGVSDGTIAPLLCRKKLMHTFLRDKGPM